MSKRRAFVVLGFGAAWLMPAMMMAQAAAADDAGAQRASLEHGRAVLEGKGGCLACHRVADHGSHLGPDLSTIGADRKPAEIRKALLDPPAVVEERYQLYEVVTRTGQKITGRLMNQDRTSIQLLDSTDRLRSFAKGSLSHYGFTTTPAMPSYRSTLSADEQSDLVNYLTTLKGVVRQ